MNVEVPVPGATLLARVEGPQDAPWLVLSNSLASDHTMWDPQIPLLTQRYRVLRYDTRGHGASDAPDGPYSFDMLVADVVALMDHFGIQQASFMGLSLGGMTGLGLALAHPSRVSRLVCCDARADAPEEVRKSWDERLKAVDAGGMAAVLQGTLERWLAPHTRHTRKELVKRCTDMILRTQVAGYKGCAAALKALNYAPDLPRIRVPVLFVVGEHDPSTPPAVMRPMADAVPGAAYEIVPLAAHIANLDNERGFAEAIAAFLGLKI